MQVLLRMLPKDPSELAWDDVVPAPDPSVVFSYTKLLWASGAREEAVARLRVLRDSVLEPALRLQSTKLEEAGQEIAQQPPSLSSKNIAEIAIRIDDLRRLMSKWVLSFSSNIY